MAAVGYPKLEKSYLVLKKKKAHKFKSTSITFQAFLSNKKSLRVSWNWLEFSVGFPAWTP